MSDENSTGVVLPYETKAQHGDEMPNGLDYPDQLMFQALALLYARYRLKIITRERAQQEKKKLLDDYRVYQFQWEMGDHWVKILKDTEIARAEYRKNRTLENADKLLLAVEGTGIHGG